jgi:alpha-ketoglutarate-dependent taurine dioxygenase
MAFKLSFLKPNIQLPLVIEPEETLPSICHQDLLDWLLANKSFLTKNLQQYGGILFRGFPISTAAEFNSVVQTIEPRTLTYIEGQSPRTKVHDQIYTSTEYPANQTITLHNELSYTHNPPKKIFFFCEIPPQIDGETPITDCRKIYEKMNPQIRDRFVSEKICYVKNMHGGNQFGKSWQQTLALLGLRGLMYNELRI